GASTVAARPAPVGTPGTSLSNVGPPASPGGTWTWKYTFVYSDGVESTASGTATQSDGSLSNPLCTLTITVGDARVTDRFTYGIPNSNPATSNRDSVGDNTSTSKAMGFQVDGVNLPPTSTPGY